MTRRILVTIAFVPLAASGVARGDASAPASVSAPATTALPEFALMLRTWRASANAAVLSTQLPHPGATLNLAGGPSANVVSDQPLPAALGDWNGSSTAPGVSATWGAVGAGSTFNAARAMDSLTSSAAPATTQGIATGSYLNWVSAKPLDDHVAQLEVALASGGQVTNPDGSPGTFGDAVSAKGLLKLPLGWKLNGDWTQSDLNTCSAAQTWDLSASGTIEHPWGQAKATATFDDVDAGYASLADPTPATGSRSGQVTVRQDVAKGPLTGTLKVVALGSSVPNVTSLADGDEIGRRSAEGSAHLRLALLPSVSLIATGSLTALNQAILGAPDDSTATDTSTTVSATSATAPSTSTVASPTQASNPVAPATPATTTPSPAVSTADPTPAGSGNAAAPTATASTATASTTATDGSAGTGDSAATAGSHTPYYADQSQVGAADVGLEWKLMPKTSLTATLGGTHTGVNRFLAGSGWDPTPVSLLNEYRLSLALTQQNREGSWSMTYSRKTWDDMLAESGLTSIGYSGRDANVLSLSSDRPLLFNWRLHASLDWADTIDSTLTQPQAHRVQVGLQMQKFGSLNFSFCDGAAYASDGLDGSSDVNLTFRTGTPIGNQHLSLELGYTREGALASAPTSDFTVGVTYK